MSFQPNDFVEALVDDDDGECAAIHRGTIYRVESVEPELWRECMCNHGPDCRGDGVTLYSPQLKQGQFWCSTLFKPVYRPDNSLFNHIIENIDETVA